MASTNMGPNDGAPDGVQAGESEFDRRTRRRERFGLILVIVGALALLSDLGVFSGLNNVIGMLIFAALGGFALNHYVRRRRIGSLVGAFVLFGLAAATVGGAAAGFYFLALTGVGFAAVYYVDRDRWWAVIPAGTLFSLAVIAGLDSWAPGYDASWVLFAGLALTFGVLWQLPGEPKSWAIYPALASAVLAVLGVSFGGGWVVPLLLVAVGVYMLLRQQGERGREAVAGGSAGNAGTVGSGEVGNAGTAAGSEMQADATEAHAGSETAAEDQAPAGSDPANAEDGPGEEPR